MILLPKPSMSGGPPDGAAHVPPHFWVFVWKNVDVKEIQNETTDHKISLHADNVLLFLWNK